LLTAFAVSSLLHFCCAAKASTILNTISNLINLPKGQRPLRTVVDFSTGDIIKRANDAVKVELEKVLTAFGMEDLLA